MRTVIENGWGCRLRQLATLSLFLVGVAAGCQDARSDPVGGETHFLRACDSGASVDTCGRGFACLCDVCTRSCDEQRACPAFPGVECVSPGASCAAAGSSSVCDVSCSDDGDCLALSDAHACVEGFCRAGNAAPPGNGPLEPLDCEPGSVSAARVLMIGDNLFAGSNDVSVPLVASAESADILQPGEVFRNHATATNAALAYMGSAIAEQYTAGNADGNVRLVIMTGGGVDAVFGACAEPNAECPVLVSAADAARELLLRMATDGVAHVVYVFYPDAGDPAQKARVDALRSLIEPACAVAPVPCYFLDLRRIFEGHYGEYVIPEEGLSVSGAAATAGAIWGVVGQCLAP